MGGSANSERQSICKPLPGSESGNTEGRLADETSNNADDNSCSDRHLDSCTHPLVAGLGFEWRGFFGNRLKEDNG